MMRRIFRGRLVNAGIAVSFIFTLLLFAVAPATAQDAPVRIIYGFPAGSVGDTLTRILADYMRGPLGRPVVVENRPGAAGILANELVKSARSDGGTILLTPLATMVAFPHSYSKLSYDPLTDYVPLVHVSAFQLALGVGEKVPAKTVAEYVALVKKGGEYSNYASAAAGSLPHFFGVMFARTAGLEMTHVPYRGTGAVLPALIGGEIPAAVLPIADIGGLAKEGKARLLAVSGAQRSPAFPEVPTFKEMGYDIEGSAWYATFAPAGTPEAASRPLVDAMMAALKDPAIRARIAALGLEPTGLGPAQLGAIVKADYERWGPVIKASGFKSD
jgi:tripartite-type tricarboxylate transporter receptor subunit TctC